MKIALLYAHWEGEPWSTPLGFRAELERRGHEIGDFNLYHDNGILPKAGGHRRYSNQGINQMHLLYTNNEWRPDVVFLMDYGPFDAVQYDKRWFPDAVWVFESGDEPQSHRMQMPKAAKSDLVLSPDKQCVERYQQMGINAHWWTHCADTDIFKPYDEEIKHSCVTTCGPRGGGTTDIIKRDLGDEFFNDRYFWGEEYGRVLNRGKMVFQHSQYKEITRRVFEGMACGKMVITDRLPAETGMEELFVDGHDIVYFDNAHDAIAKIKYYAANDEEREEIAANGFMKVVERHSVRARIDEFERLVDECRASKV